MVEAGISPPDLAVQGFSALLPLLAGFLAGFFLSGGIFPSAGEGAWTAGGALGLFAGGGLALLIRRRRPSRRKTSILRVL
jgi:sigma-E factor negative regulatory protein RseC